MEQITLQRHRIRFQGKTAVFAVLLCLPLMFVEALADVLQPMPVQELAAGESLDFPLIWLTEPSRRLQIQIGRAPSGARIGVNDDAKLAVMWASPSVVAESIIEIVASDVDTSEVLDTKLLVVRVASSVEPAAAGALASSASGATSEAVAARRSDRTVFERPVMPLIANQVVSSGRPVSIVVTADIPDGSPPDLQVDRLPRNASFDANEDGSRTFYWQTGDRDQGEHLYRFSAINPNAPGQRTVQEVLIVVGDPSRTRTFPAREQVARE